MDILFFHEVLTRRGLDPAAVRLLRHDARGTAAWMRGRFDSFGCYVSFQRMEPSPYRGVTTACHFIAGPVLPDGDVTGLFIGTTEILDRWDWDGARLPVLQDSDVLAAEVGQTALYAHDLTWRAETADLSERILIRWGAVSAARAWSQWANRKPKEVVEIRQVAREDPFPGFSRFQAQISALASLPQAWRGALGSVGGVYLLVAQNGEQYVGSATGAQGFWGRWSAYVADGHGGNVRLRARGFRDYGVSVLEVASPDMTATDVLAREAFWKEKLGARAFGLNAN